MSRVRAVVIIINSKMVYKILMATGMPHLFVFTSGTVLESGTIFAVVLNRRMG